MNGQRALRVSRYGKHKNCWTYQHVIDGRPVSLPISGNPMGTRGEQITRALSLGLDRITPATLEFEKSGQDFFDYPLTGGVS